MFLTGFKPVSHSNSPTASQTVHYKHEEPSLGSGPEAGSEGPSQTRARARARMRACVSVCARFSFNSLQCYAQRDLQGSVNHRNFERLLRSLAWVSHQHACMRIGIMHLGPLVVQYQLHAFSKRWQSLSSVFLQILKYSKDWYGKKDLRIKTKLQCICVCLYLFCWFNDGEKKWT